MKDTGIVRYVDDLGRVVIPKEIRRTLDIHEGDPIEMWIEKGNIILKRVSRNGNFQAALSRVISDLQESESTEKRVQAIQILRQAEKILED